MKRDMNFCLFLLNLFMGTIVVFTGFYKYSINRYNLIPLYIALAIIIVGPVEDLLNKLINKMSISDDKRKLYSKMVDLLTSLAFLILLWLVIIETR